MGIDRKYVLSFTLAVNDVTKKVEGIHQNVSMLCYTSLNILILFICMELISDVKILIRIYSMIQQSKIEV